MLTPEREKFIRFLCHFFPHDCIVLAPEGAIAAFGAQERFKKL